jgi:hypothetical protein
MKIVPSHAVPAIATRFAPAPPPTKRVNFPPAAPLGIDTNPILFYDSVSVQPNAEAAMKSDAFTNNLRKPVELHSMRIATSIPFNPATDSAQFVSGLGVVALQLSIDDKPITRGFVPAWLLAPSDNRRNDTATVGDALGVTRLLVWNFSAPIQLRLGSKITVQVKHLGYVDIAAQVFVAFAGRTVPSLAGSSRIPYVIGWSSKTFAYDENRTETSRPSDLASDLDREMRIERFIGRFAAYNPGDPTTPAVKSLVDYDDFSVQSVTSTRLRMSLSQNRPILRFQTMWRAVFGQNAAFETDFILRPKDYLTAEVQHVAGPVLATPFDYFAGQAQISIVGSREA